jgi:hypothetical protein
MDSVKLISMLSYSYFVLFRTVFYLDNFHNVQWILTFWRSLLHHVLQRGVHTNWITRVIVLWNFVQISQNVINLKSNNITWRILIFWRSLPHNCNLSRYCVNEILFAHPFAIMRQWTSKNIRLHHLIRLYIYSIL